MAFSDLCKHSFLFSLLMKFTLVPLPLAKKLFCKHDYLQRFSYCLLVSLFLFMSTVSAQNISVNTSGAMPDSSAMLDVVSTNKGFLMPRVSLTSITDVNTIPNPAVSLLVYNINAGMISGSVGFWYWSGTRWMQALGGIGSTGNTGASGSNGATGNTGNTGANGANGLSGATGNVGATGASGINGINGTNGLNGNTGVTGFTGAKGADGTNGLNGATGNTGANGIIGATGAVGSTGNVGATGANGTNGTNGVNGSTGNTGAAGANGINGTNGATGNDGAIGASGLTGNTGVTGPSGSKGSTGATGTDGAKNAWGLVGTTGTIDGTSFIGTADNIPLNFRVNNIAAGRIDQTLSNAFFGYQAGNTVNNAGSDNVAVGTYALNANTSGSVNVANGSYALYANTSGVRNTALGFYAMAGTTSGAENTAIGTYSLSSNTDGTRNTATGNEALAGNTTGIYNTGTGYYALHDNSTGNFNTGFGYGAGYTITGSNNTFIGAFATPAGSSALTNATALGANAQVSASNCLVLGSGANVGIGISAPTHKLDVNGTLNVNGITTCTSGAWASSDQLFKNNIDSITNALGIINQLKPHTFFFDVNNPYGLNFSNQKQYGMVAQEVAQVLPELIATTHKGATLDTAGVQLTPAVSYLTLNYNAFIAILMKGMQEQEQKITNQDAVINALQQQLNTLSNQVQQLQGQH